MRRYTAQPCSKGRGLSSSSHVLIVNADFTSWRWYSPRSYQRISKGQALDEGLPPNLTCRIRKGSWLYRCMGRDPSRQPGRNSPEQATWSTDRKSCPTDPWTFVGTDPIRLTRATESCTAQMTSIGIDGATNLRAVCKDRKGEHVELWSVRRQGRSLDFSRTRSEGWDGSPVTQTRFSAVADCRLANQVSDRALLKLSGCDAPLRLALSLSTGNGISGELIAVAPECSSVDRRPSGKLRGNRRIGRGQIRARTL